MKYTVEEIKHFCIGMDCEFICENENPGIIQNGVIELIRPNINLFSLDNPIAIYDYDWWIAIDNIINIPIWDKIRNKKLTKLLI